MKRCLISFLLLILFVAGFAFPVRISSWNIGQDVKTINALKLSIDTVSHKQGVIIVDARNNNDLESLKASGFLPELLPDITKEYYHHLVDSSKDGPDPMNQYFSIDEYIAFMQNTANNYPQICQLHQFGTSIQDRPLYAMKISDNVSQNEAEPEVKLVASIHGDETVGYDAMIRLIQILTTSYNTDPRLTNIVNNTELWITPLMNPDGYANGVRYNAAGVDLNRNFPMPNGTTNPDGNPTAPENLAMIDFSNQHNFVCGINFHGGALVINYPWDYTYSLSPDNELIRELALTYSSHNLPMYNSDEFDQGITNGAAWYVITGSMQDWNYAFCSNIELTAEISNIKWPPASTLDSYWEDNRESILSFIEYAQNGIKGTVTNAEGIAIPAEISILEPGKTIVNDSQIGDYHRILLPGTYHLKVSSPGYLPQVAELTVPATGHITQNFVLEQASLMQISGIVRDEAGFPVAGAILKVDSQPPIITQSNAEGEFSIMNIYEGDYRVSVNADSGIFSGDIGFRRHGDEDLIVISLSTSIFTEDFESGIANWNVNGTWAIVDIGSNAVLTDSPAGNYGNNQNRTVTLANPISLAEINNPRLDFRAKWDIESGYDFVHVEASTNGTAWETLDSITGYQEEWIALSYSLESFVGSNLYLRFRLRSDWSENGDGIYIDDIRVYGNDPLHPLYGDLNMDGVVSPADVQLSLDYTVGTPLSAEQIANGDTNGENGLNTLDAYNILRYLKDPSYLFPVQDPNSPDLSECTLTASLSEDTLLVSPDAVLRCLQMDIPFNIQVLNMNFAETPLYYAMNSDSGLFSLATYYSVEDLDLGVQLLNPEPSFNIPCEINGYTSVLEVNPTNAQDSQIPGLPFALNQNIPNPFNPDTMISFSLPQRGPVSLAIYNNKGQMIRSLIDGSTLEAGAHTFTWDGRDKNGTPISSGIYLYRLQSGANRQTRKMVLSK